MQKQSEKKNEVKKITKAFNTKSKTENWENLLT